MVSQGTQEDIEKRLKALACTKENSEVVTLGATMKRINSACYLRCSSRGTPGSGGLLSSTRRRSAPFEKT